MSICIRSESRWCHFICDSSWCSFSHLCLPLKVRKQENTMQCVSDADFFFFCWIGCLQNRPPSPLTPSLHNSQYNPLCGLKVPSPLIQLHSTLFVLNTCVIHINTINFNIVVSTKSRFNFTKRYGKWTFPAALTPPGQQLSLPSVLNSKNRSNMNRPGHVEAVDMTHNVVCLQFFYSKEPGMCYVRPWHRVCLLLG